MRYFIRTDWENVRSSVCQQDVLRMTSTAQLRRWLAFARYVKQWDEKYSERVVAQRFCIALTRRCPFWIVKTDTVRTLWQIFIDLPCYRACVITSTFRWLNLRNFRETLVMLLSLTLVLKLRAIRLLATLYKLNIMMYVIHKLIYVWYIKTVEKSVYTSVTQRIYSPFIFQ